MMDNDTVKLLQECDAGIKMGLSSLDEVLPKVEDQALRGSLERSRKAHAKLGDETRTLLSRQGSGGKEPNPVAKGMSWVKAKALLSLEGGDQAVASLITDGCGMGVKSLGRTLNQYPNADGQAKSIAHRLMGLEEGLAQEVRPYL